MTQQLTVDQDQHKHKHTKQYITHHQSNLTNNSPSDNMNPKTHIKQGNKGRTKYEEVGYNTYYEYHLREKDETRAHTRRIDEQNATSYYH